jgi:hypothetical protein
MPPHGARASTFWGNGRNRIASGLTLSGNGRIVPASEDLPYALGVSTKVVYLNRGDGRFDDVTERLGGPLMVPKAGRGAAFADFDNDGDVDVLVNNVHDTPDLFRLDVKEKRNWIARRLAGTKSNRSDRGARPRRCGRIDAGRRGSRRRQLLLAERSAPAFWSGRCGQGRSSRGSMAERWGRGMDRPDVNRIVTLTEGTGQPLGTPVRP